MVRRSLQGALAGCLLAALAQAGGVVLKDDQLETLAKWVAEAGAQSTAAPQQVPSEGGPSGPFAVYVALRQSGRRLGEGWGSGPALRDAVRSARAAAGGDARGTPDTAEVCVAGACREYDLAVERDRRRFYSNVHRGVLGVEIQLGQRTERYAPTYVLASNRSHRALVERFAASAQVTVEALERDGSFRMFPCDQCLVDLGGTARVRRMERGNLYVAPGGVSHEAVAATAALAGGWLAANVDASGRMLYKYWPSNGSESTENNMIRQWMATTALGRWASEQRNADLWRVSERNIDYNLDTFFRLDADGTGWIAYGGQEKLGAAALAALAIVEHPNRTRWASYETALRRGVDQLWDPATGAFTTFHVPSGRNACQNFYPGEALLLWATTYAETKDPDLLARIMLSFARYRDYHLRPENRNPAFVPWHTQAYCIVWRETHNPELRDFVFEMNDWLLSVQQWDGVEYPDIAGRFYDPDRPFGPPHASSTGVYLEGLADAFALAREVGDSTRAQGYRSAILRGLRSAMQLQFVDDLDMFYVSESKRPMVHGAFRTTVYDNEVRCDNTQHILMALLKVLDTFVPADFR